MHRRYAFTLIELVACIAIMALLSAAAGVSLHSRHGTMSLDAAADVVISVDRQARQRARQSGQPVTIRVDMAVGEVIDIAAPGASHFEAAEPLRLPEGFRIARARVGGRWVQDGTLDVRCSSQGRTASYAVLVEGNSGHTWLIFAGLTGAMERMDDEGQVAEILQ
jgi:type II secretion system protein H